MAIRKPLVLVAGQVQQLQTGDTVLAARRTLAVAASLIGYGQILSSVSGFAPAAAVIKVVSTLAYPGRLRLYSSQAAQIADALRTYYQPPLLQSQHQVILDLLLDDTTGYTWFMSPAAYGATTDDTDTIWFTIDNFSPLALDHEYTLTFLPLE